MIPRLLCSDRLRRLEDIPASRHPFELIFTTILKGRPRTRDQVGDRSRHEDLASVGQCGNPSPDVDPDAAQVVASPDAFSSVDSSAKLNSQCPRFAGSGKRAEHCPRRALERCKESVTGGLDSETMEAIEMVSHHLVVAVEQGFPTPVAMRGCLAPATDPAIGGSLLKEGGHPSGRDPDQPDAEHRCSLLEESSWSRAERVGVEAPFLAHASHVFLGDDGSHLGETQVRP